MPDKTVGQLAELYLGNILYAIELAALALEGQGRRDDAAFYRGIARKLAEAHGEARGRPPAAGGPGRERVPTAEPRAGGAEDPASPPGAPSGAY